MFTKIKKIIVLVSRLETIALKMGVDYYLLLDKIASEIEVENNKLNFKINVVELTAEEKKKNDNIALQKIEKDTHSKKNEEIYKVYQLMKLQYFAFPSGILQQQHNFAKSFISLGKVNVNEGMGNFYSCFSNGQEIASKIKKIIEDIDLNGNRRLNQTYKTLSTSKNFFTLREKSSDGPKQIYYQIKESDLIIEEATFLMVAAHYGSYQAIDSLVKNGCDIKLKCSVGRTALDYFNKNILAIQEYLSTDEINLTIAKLDGTYKNGYYVAMYEKEELEKNISKIVDKAEDNGAIDVSKKKYALKL